MNHLTLLERSESVLALVAIRYTQQQGDSERQVDLCEVETVRLDS